MQVDIAFEGRLPLPTLPMRGRVDRRRARDLGPQRQHVAESFHVELGVGREPRGRNNQKIVGALGDIAAELEVADQQIYRLGPVVAVASTRPPRLLRPRSAASTVNGRLRIAAALDLSAIIAWYLKATAPTGLIV